VSCTSTENYTWSWICYEISGVLLYFRV